MHDPGGRFKPGLNIPVDVLAQFDRVTEHWSPKVIAQVNDQYVKVARLLGELDWHSHAGEDELFWVLRGALRIELRDRVVELTAGQCCVVPRGVEHHPVAAAECWIVLIEPVTTRHSRTPSIRATPGRPDWPTSPAR